MATVAVSEDVTLSLPNTTATAVCGVQSPN